MGRDPDSPDRFSAVFSPPPPQRPSLLRTARHGILKLVVAVVMAQAVVAVAVIVGVVAVATFGTLTDREGAPSDIVTAMTDVHSLDVNPSDGAVYAATVRGLYRIEAEDRALRIAENLLSALGFTVIAPEEFLAGGRPDIRDRASDLAPSEAGLIHTINAGHSWQTVSLAGEALLTALALANGTLYAYDELSGSLIVSTDIGETWETRSQPGTLTGIAVDPANGTDIVAITREQGLLISTDGGRTWESRDSAALAYVEWPATEQLWGAGNDGVLYSSRDAGRTWQPEGTAPGELTAFHAEGSLLYVALDDGRVLSSGDRGLTWTLLYQAPLPD